MPHHISDRLDADAAREQAKRKGVTQLVHMNRPGESRFPGALLEDVLNCGALDRTAWATRTQEELRVLRPLLVTVMAEVPSQQAQRWRSQWKLQVGPGLALADVENARIPIDGIQAQWRHLRRSKTVVRQEMKNAQIAPSRLATSIDGGEQPTHGRPGKRLRRLLALVGLRRVKGVEPAICMARQI